MVLLPCPRLQREVEVNAEDPEQCDASVSSHDITPETQCDDPALDEQALEIIFGQSNVTVGPSGTAPSMYSALTDMKHRQKGKLSLSLLTHKLREKLSRESWLSKKPSTNPDPPVRMELQIEARSSGQVVSASTDILASIAASDGGYDSDARNILTPQIVAQLATSPPGDNSNGPQGIISTIESTQESSQSSLQLGYDGTVSESFDPSGDDSTPSQSGQTLPLPDETIGLATTREELDISRYNTHKPQEIFERVQFVNSTPTRKSKFAREDDDSASLKAIKRPWPLEHSEATAPCYNEPSTYKKPNPASGSQVKRTLSFSVYSDRESQDIGSASSHKEENSRNKTLQTELKCNNASPGKGLRATRLLEGEEGQSSVHSTSLLSDNHSIRGLCPSTVLHIPRVRPRVSINQQEEPVTLREKSFPNLVQSRFIENLDDVFLDNATGLSTNEGTSNQQRHEIRKTSEGWLSGGKRLGYNYDFVAGKDVPSTQIQEECTVNQYVLVTPPSVTGASHDNEEISPEVEKDQGISELKLDTSTQEAPEGSHKKSSGLLERLGLFGKRKGRRLASTDSGLTDVMLSEVRDLNLHKPDVWQVFGDDEDGKQPRGNKRRLFLKRRKRASISNGTGCRVSEHNSPTSQKVTLQEGTGEKVANEVEIDSFGQLQNDNVTTTAYSDTEVRVREASPTRFSLATEQEASIDDGFTGKLGAPNSAEAWSQMYQNCVENPATEDELGSISSGGSDHAQYAQTFHDDCARSASSGASTRAQYARTILETIDENVGSNSTDLRESTLEFREGQLAAEVATREGLLRMVNDTLGEVSSG
ncbi:hypothetical protein PRK78_000876 [Emydomyces testavorans]|uniref:Uncharacterized protein n=1 Tax=Emydomyces testavorans TaxID=2070801 RepID=A0AAF0DCA9_9EURO|nr:hypothetical protein PRK78_000876 [Emydomyces testavorans]